MTVQNPPYVLQASSHSAELFRRAISSLLAGPGVNRANDLLVSAHISNMSVDVAAGVGWVAGTESAFQGSYYVLNDAVLNLAVAAADPTNPRRDLVVVRIKDAQYSGAVNAASIEVLTGTPAASPVDPTIPANCLLLARIAVTPADVTVLDFMVTDLRRQALSPVWHNVGASGEPAFQNGWTNNLGRLARFARMPDGFVHLEGDVTGGTVGSTLFTLPVDCRPPWDRVFPVALGTHVWINAAGNVWSTSSSYYLNGISFSTTL